MLPTLTHARYFEPAIVRERRGGAGIAAIIATIVVGAAVVLAWAAPAIPARGTAAAPATLPAAARGPVSEAIGRHQAAYRLAGLHGDNARERLRVAFSRAGAAIATGSAQVRLGFASYGRADALQVVVPAAPRAHANRVDIAHGGVREWWANGPAGLEQGFDVRARPAGHGALTLALNVSGDLRARMAGSAVALEGRGRSLRYGGLTATDAHGRDLPAHLAVRAGQVRIAVDDRNATYPIKVDPFVQQAHLTASDGVTADLFGTGLALDGDTVAVGAGNDDVSADADRGAVYVFQKPASGWADMTQVAILTASDGAAGDSLNAVGVAGDTIVAGASGHKVGANDQQGAVYVFQKPPGGWHDMNQTAELTDGAGGAHDGLGSSVGISGDTVVAGAPGRTVGTHVQQGQADVFVKPAGGWANMTQTARLTAFDGGPQDALGLVNSVAISGDLIVAGADSHDVGGSADEGAAYVFFKPAGGWTDMFSSLTLAPSDGGAGDLFGFAVAIDDDIVAVGSLHHQVGLARQGAAYVYTRPFGSPTTETQTAELTASDGVNDDRFGAQLAVSGNNVLVGAFPHQVGNNRGQGAAYLFSKPGPVWKNMTETQQITAADGATGDGFADAVAFSGDTAVISAPIRTVNGNVGQGQVYVFQNVAAAPPAGGGSSSGGSGGTGTTSVAGGSTSSPGSSAPVLTGVRVSRSVFRDGRKLARIAQRRPVGTTFSFALDQPATVRLDFRKGARRAGTLTLAGHAGANRLHFEGRLSRRKKLKPGSYTVRLTATNAAGQATTSKTLRFRVVR